jgi:hypothetical protein
MKIDCKNPTEIAKEMFWLAWQACGGPEGMGFLQNRPNATKEEVWSMVTGQAMGDYPVPIGKGSRPYADYVFGRMMKFGVEIHEDHLLIQDSKPRNDYQSWCRVYPTHDALLKAARHNVEEKT